VAEAIFLPFALALQSTRINSTTVHIFAHHRDYHKRNLFHNHRGRDRQPKLRERPPTLFYGFDLPTNKSMKLDVTCMRYLSKDDYRVLTAVEMGMKNHDVVPVELIVNIAKLRHGGAQKFLNTLLRFKLIYNDKTTYDGRCLRVTFEGGYDLDVIGRVQLLFWAWDIQCRPSELRHRHHLTHLVVFSLHRLSTNLRRV